jgi:DNA polymerase-4
MSHYAAVSAQVMDILRSVTPLVEKVSIDEAFLDVTGALRDFPDAVAIARHLKQRIAGELRLTASVGVAPNKFLAKLASDLDKPDGLTVVPTDAAAIIEFLAPLPVKRIWGVGKVTERQLARYGIRTIGDVQRLDLGTLARYVGTSLADHLWRLSRGEDERPVVTEREEKSISNEETFEEDCDDRERVRQTLIELTEKVGRRLRRSGKLARTGQIKIRFEDFTTLTRQQSFPVATSADRALIDCALALFERLNVRRPVRLVGFGVSNLVAPDELDTRQPTLFSNLPPDGEAARQQALDRAVDELRTKYGTDILKRGEWP